MRNVRVAALLLSMPCVAFSQALNDHDNGPLIGIFGLPNSTEGGHLTDRGRHDWNFAAMTSSHSIIKIAPDEWLKFDGETTRLALNYRYGVTDRLEFGVELPYVFHDSGNLDSMIVAWHSLFGFKNGARNVLPENSLDFEYADRSGELVEIDRSSNGIADIRLIGGYHLLGSERSETSLRFSIKLPTGDSSRLHGSGSMDVSVGIAGDYLSLWGLEKLNGFYRLSGTYLGEPEYLRDRYRRFVGKASGGFGYHLTGAVELRVQASLRGPLYESHTNTLGDIAAMITFGANFRLPGGYRFALGVSEDINVHTAPDVTFILALSHEST